MAKGADKKRAAQNAVSIGSLVTTHAVVSLVSLFLVLWYSLPLTTTQTILTSPILRHWLLLQGICTLIYWQICSYARVHPLVHLLSLFGKGKAASPPSSGGDLNDTVAGYLFDIVYLCWIVLLLGPVFPKIWAVFLLVPAYAAYRCFALVCDVHLFLALFL